MELEGLRGIAAIIVVIYHNMLAFYAVAFLGIGQTVLQNDRFGNNLYGNPILGLFSGTFAVAIFFVLSGFVLSIAYFKGRKPETVKRMAIKRYPRLMIPALASTLLCFVLIKLGLSHTQAATAITDSWWLGNGWNFVSGFRNALWSGMVGIFVSGGSAYNNPLWTMQIEFIGSFLVFAFLLLFSSSRYRWITYALLAVITFNTWFLAFVIGMSFADLYSAGYIKKHKRNLLGILALIAGAVTLGGYPYSGTKSGLYSIVNFLPSAGINYLIVSTVFGAAIMVFVVLWAEQISKILSKKYISIFGKYTFSLYLVHIPILYTFTTGMFLLFIGSHLSYNLSVVLAFVLSIPILAVTTILFEKYVDVPSIKLGSKLADLYDGTTKVAFISTTKTHMKRIRFLTIRWLGTVKGAIIDKE